jgi:hypothetical protein
MIKVHSYYIVSESDIAIRELKKKMDYFSKPKLEIDLEKESSEKREK